MENTWRAAAQILRHYKCSSQSFRRLLDRSFYPIPDPDAELDGSVELSPIAYLLLSMVLDAEREICALRIFLAELRVKQQKYGQTTCASPGKAQAWSRAARDLYGINKTMSNRILQANSKMCFICGLENPVGLKLRIYEVEPGVVESRYTAPEVFQGYPGVLHGGIVATIIDEVSGRSHMGPVEKPRFMFTARLEVIYRKNVPIGRPLKIVGKAGRDKGRSAEAWAGIYDAETGELLAEGKTLLVNVPQEKLDDASLEDLGWKVYPDNENPREGDQI